MSKRWDDHFIELAAFHAKMSKDPSSKIGSVVVGPDREIRSVGFNGFPRKIVDSYDRLNDRAEKLNLMVHAEMNAIAAAAKVGIPLNGCSIYTACIKDEKAVGFGPCTRCAVHIIQTGITSVVTKFQESPNLKWEHDLKNAVMLFAEAGVSYREVC